MNQILNIGDKVRFLNDVGGGRISGFQKGNIVLVEDEDGFEVPVREQEVVLVDSAERKLNNSNAGSKVAEQAEDSEYKQANNVPTPHTAYINIEERIAHLERTVKRLQLRIEELESAKSLHERLKDSNIKVTETKKHIKQDTADGILEIDLHATELLDTTAGMNATDIKEYQLDVFRRTMKEHLKDKGRRIVFIHGNGDGVLRRAILSELRRDYSHCQWQDASFQQYGFGATMVTIR